MIEMDLAPGNKVRSISEPALSDVLTRFSNVSSPLVILPDDRDQGRKSPSPAQTDELDGPDGHRRVQTIDDFVPVVNSEKISAQEIRELLPPNYQTPQSRSKSRGNPGFLNPKYLTFKDTDLVISKVHGTGWSSGNSSLRAMSKVTR